MLFNLENIICVINTCINIKYWHSLEFIAWSFHFLFQTFSISFKPTKRNVYYVKRKIFADIFRKSCKNLREVLISNLLKCSWKKIFTWGKAIGSGRINYVSFVCFSIDDLCCNFVTITSSYINYNYWVFLIINGSWLFPRMWIPQDWLRGVKSRAFSILWSV